MPRGFLRFTGIRANDLGLWRISAFIQKMGEIKIL